LCNMKKTFKVLLLILGLILICFFIYKGNSFSFALANAGFNVSDIDTLEHGFDNNNKEFKVIKTSTGKEKVVLAIMTKNKLGIWSISLIHKNENNGVVSIGWFGDGGVKRYEQTENPIFFNETHIVYYGTNAIKLIELLPDQLPDNVTVSVSQAGEIFSIHLLTRGDSDILNSINVVDLLIQNKCISNK